MPTGQPLCPRCNDNLFVRAEQIISGRRVMRAFYCGRCNHEWQIESAPPIGEERRKAERRRAARVRVPKRDRRKLG
jgi:transposase-like protein